MIVLDRLVLMYDEIKEHEFEQFILQLDYFERNMLIPEVKKKIGTSMKEYHYNVNVGAGEGAIYIGYKHNRNKDKEPHYTMKVELNPQKKHEKHQHFYDILHQITFEKPCRVTTMDFAHDIPVPIKAIMVHTTTGREENRIKGTKTYGLRNNDGHLKVYDKKVERERKGYEVPEDHLTRIEYTWKDKKGIAIEEINRDTIKISQYYNIYQSFSLGKVRPEIMSYILAIQNGYFQLKDFTRSNQKHIKDILENQSKIDLDKMIEENWEEIKEIVITFARQYSVKSMIA